MAILADENTRVIVQGITGREAATFTKDMSDYGTKVVAGVTPGKQGQNVHGVAVFDTVRRAVKEHPAKQLRTMTHDRNHPVRRSTVRARPTSIRLRTALRAGPSDRVDPSGVAAGRPTPAKR